MNREPKQVRFEELALNPETLFETIATRREPVLVEKGGVIFRIEIVGWREPKDIWEDYDPQQTRAALKKSAGALTGIDREQLLTDIHAARQQDSHGRPA